MPELSASEIAPDGTLTVKCTVTNTGSLPGAEVAQLYVRDHVASLIRPIRELRGFQKVTLAPGESRELTFALNASDMAYHTEGSKTIVEAGEFSVWVSPDSTEGIPAKFNITEQPANIGAK